MGAHALHPSQIMHMIWKSEIEEGMWHVWGRGDMLTGFQWGNQKETHHLEDLTVDGRQILKCIFKK